MFRTSAIWNFAREGGKELSVETRKHILLGNLPRTALPADIRRTIRREKLVGVDDVQLDHYRFTQNRRAYITLSHPDFLKQNIAKLEKASIGGYLVTANPHTPPPPGLGTSRGVKGREAAAKRGAMTGTGPSGNMGNGRHVCVWGFPPKASPESVKEFLESHNLEMLGNKPEIYKVPL
ncbi:hypothetical protein HYDPIDRAFT_36311 [Hydnomerulius pinastri MD-312]|nr:hypothetical protein HYDPIDRAFT_36311 [Hydnomerulius pinastri MD-312]